MKLYNDEECSKKEERLFISLILIMAAILIAISITKCNAQSKARVDTIAIEYNCIKNYIVDDKQAKPKIYVVYKDSINDIEEIISMSMSTYEYVCNCIQYRIRPTLGIRLRNGQITSIVKYRTTYVRRRRL